MQVAGMRLAVANSLSPRAHAYAMYSCESRDSRLQFHLKGKPEALSKCLAAVDWRRCEATQEVAAMLREWAPPSPEMALGLLDARFADKVSPRHTLTRRMHMHIHGTM